MRISTIALANLKRRKGRAAFLVIGIAIGIGTAVALLSLSGSIKEEIGAQLDRFGANIVVVPQSNNLSLDYGGVAVSSVSFDVQQLKGEDAASVYDIPLRNRISLVSPKLLGAVRVGDLDVLLAGPKPTPICWSATKRRARSDSSSRPLKSQTTTVIKTRTRMGTPRRATCNSRSAATACRSRGASTPWPASSRRPARRKTV